MEKLSRVIRQIPLIVLITVAFAFTFNELNPKGIDVKHQYFPPKTVTRPPEPQATPTPGKSAEQQFQWINTEAVRAYFESQEYQRHEIIFIDARNEELFDEGHIPGAHLIDYYNWDEYISPALKALEKARKIVVYCVGGDCEDSRYVASALWDYGYRNIMVYEDGFDHWRSAGLPVETKSYRELYGNQ